MLFGSAGMPAGAVAEPDSPELMPSLAPGFISGGAVGTRALGLAPAAGSVGVVALGPGCRFCTLLGSAGLPAGDCANAGAAIIVAATAVMVIKRNFISVTFLSGFLSNANPEIRERFPLSLHRARYAAQASQAQTMDEVSLRAAA
jgi:hypothetical protein